MSTAGYGAAANVVGGELQGWAALLEKWAMADQYEAELKRQAGFRDEALGQFNTRVGTAGAATAQQQMDQGAANRMALYNQIQAVPSAFQTKSQPRGNQARDAASAQMMGQQRAALGKYSDWGLQQTIQNINTQRALSAIESKAGGQAGVLPYRMYDAQHSWDAMSEIGQAISSIGGGSTNYSAYASSPQGGGAINYAPGVSGGYDYTPPPSYNQQGDPNAGPMYAGYGGGGWAVG